MNELERRRKAKTRRREPAKDAPTAVEVAADFEPYRLIQARGLANGMSRTELAGKIGMTPARVAQIEAGVVTLKAYEVERIAEVLEQPVPFFKRGRPMARLDSGHLHICYSRPADAIEEQP